MNELVLPISLYTFNNVKPIQEEPIKRFYLFNHEKEPIKINKKNRLQLIKRTNFYIMNIIYSYSNISNCVTRNFLLSSFNFKFFFIININKNNIVDK